MEPHPARLDLETLASSLTTVQMHWTEIDDELERSGIGRKSPFDAVVNMRMLSAFGYLDELLREQIPPFSPASIKPMLLLNERVHYGTDRPLLAEYVRAREATEEKFYQHIGPIQQWYERHSARGQHPLRLAAEVFNTRRGRACQEKSALAKERQRGSRVSGGTTLCRVSICAKLTRRSGLFFYSGCGESSKIVDFSYLHASMTSQRMSMF